MDNRYKRVSRECNIWIIDVTEKNWMNGKGRENSKIQKKF
jgi:hypothetical protein